jgi:hypothetical protein
LFVFFSNNRQQQQQRLPINHHSQLVISKIQYSIITPLISIDPSSITR